MHGVDGKSNQRREGVSDLAARLEKRLGFWQKEYLRYENDRRPTGNWMLMRGNQNAPRKAQEFIRIKKRQQRKAAYRMKKILRKLAELEP